MDIWIYNGEKNIKITSIVSTAQLSGDYTQCCRSLEFSIARAAFDKNIPEIYIKLGDEVRLYDGDWELFRGYIFKRDSDAESKTISLIARDRGIYLKKNKGVYSFSGVTPEEITKRICRDAGIEAGYIAETGIAVTRFFYGVDLYSIIMTAYTAAAAKNGKKYIVRFTEGKLNVFEKGVDGEKITLRGDREIIAATYSESLENTVTRVMLYDKNGAFVKNIDNSELLGLYGVMSEYMKQSDDNTREEDAAKTLKKKGVERKTTVQNLGDARHVSGGTVYIYEPVVGLYGKFYIDGDVHTWKNGLYFNKLTLNFENMMNEQEVGQEKEAGSSGKSSKASSSGDGVSKGSFIWPAPASRVITSQYGSRVHPISGQKKMHTGIDIGAGMGTDILAADGGTCIMAGVNGGYGKCIKINHGGGLVTLYAHCSSILVSSGAKVSQGQVIGKVGSTGNSTGPHLHFEVIKNGACVNPNNYL